MLTSVDPSANPLDKVVYTAVTVGCPTAYRLKYRGGGLAKMQLLPSIMPSSSSFSASAENKAFRIKSLLGESVLTDLSCPLAKPFSPDGAWQLHLRSVRRLLWNMI